MALPDLLLALVVILLAAKLAGEAMGDRTNVPALPPLS